MKCQCGSSAVCLRITLFNPDGDAISHKYACSMHVADLLNELMAAANLIKNVAKAGSEAQN